MITPQVIFCYHGCDEATVRLALEGGQLRPSQNALDWLGKGVYFWEHSPARAKLWAESLTGRKDSKIKNPAILGAVVDLKHCLNLIDPDNIGSVSFAHDDFIAKCQRDGVSIPKNKGQNLGARYLDCAVIEHLHSLNKAGGQRDFDSIRAFFTEGVPIYKNSGLRALDHVQICIRNLDCIVGYFRPGNHMGRKRTR